MFKTPARVLALPSILQFFAHTGVSYRRPMTSAERDAQYPILAGSEPGADIEIDLDDRRAQKAIGDRVVALIDPVPGPALMRIFDVEALPVLVDFDRCTIAPPPRGASVREAVDHYVASTPAPPPNPSFRADHLAAITLRSTLQLSTWRNHKPNWQTLSRGGQTRRELPDGGIALDIEFGGSEPVAAWYDRCLRATWEGFALHRFVHDLDAGKLMLSGLLVAGLSHRAAPIPRQWYRGEGASIDLQAGSAGPYQRYKVIPEWVELAVSTRGGRLPPETAAPTTRRNWTVDQIRAEVRKLYDERQDDPPNMNEAAQLIGQRLPGASRENRIRPVLREPQFANLRRGSGQRRGG